MKESELQAGVLETAHRLQWLRAHFRAALTAKGWRTPVEGDGAGFPDLILVRAGRLVVAELKGDRGQLSVEQTMWLAAFRTVPGVEVHLWTPEDWHDGSIEAVLR